MSKAKRQFESTTGDGYVTAKDGLIQIVVKFDKRDIVISMSIEQAGPFLQALDRITFVAEEMRDGFREEGEYVYSDYFETQNGPTRCWTDNSIVRILPENDRRNTFRVDSKHVPAFRAAVVALRRELKYRADGVEPCSTCGSFTACVSCVTRAIFGMPQHV